MAPFARVLRIYNYRQKRMLNKKAIQPLQAGLIGTTIRIKAKYHTTCKLEYKLCRVVPSENGGLSIRIS